MRTSTDIFYRRLFTIFRVITAFQVKTIYDKKYIKLDILAGVD